MKIDSKTILSLSALVVSLSIGYYFVIYLPQKDAHQQQQAIVGDVEKQKADSAKEQAYLLSMQEKCKDAGEKAYNKVADEENAPGVQLVSDPRYYYSKENNQCLYEYMISSKTPDNAPKDNGIPWSRFVKDAFTNQTVLVYYHNVFDTSDKAKKDMMDFSDKEYKLMGGK